MLTKPPKGPTELTAGLAQPAWPGKALSSPGLASRRRAGPYSPGSAAIQQLPEPMSDPPARNSAVAEVQLWVTSTGGGHRRVAEAVRAAILERTHGSVRVAIDDPLAGGAGLGARALLLSYGPLVRASPSLWGALFRTFAKSWPRRTLERFLLSGLAPAMTRMTQERQPRVVVNCHPLLGLAAQVAANSLSEPARMLTIVTDLALVHPGWLSPPSSLFLSPSFVASSWCVNQGIPATQVVDVGLPIDPGIGALAGPATRRRLRLELGIDEQRLCVVVGGGAEGAGKLRPLLRAMLTSQLPLHLLVLCGRNRSLLRWVRGQAQPMPLEAIPYTPDPARWLLAADVYVGKAGPSALAEAAAAGLAILVSDALPGQERSNLELLVDAGAGIAVTGPTQLLEVLARLVADGDPLLASLRSGAAAWARPDAAALAASQILARL